MYVCMYVCMYVSLIIMLMHVSSKKSLHYYSVFCITSQLVYYDMHIIHNINKYIILQLIPYLKAWTMCIQGIFVNTSVDFAHFQFKVHILSKLVLVTSTRNKIIKMNMQSLV